MFVVLARLIDLRLCFDDETCSLVVPFELNLISLEKVLLGNWSIKTGNIENLHGTWLTLLLYVRNVSNENDSAAHLHRRYKGYDAILTAGCYRKVSDPLNPQFDPNLRKVSALIKLNLVGNRSCAVFLVLGVLKVPICLRFLNKSSDNSLFTKIICLALPR